MLQGSADRVQTFTRAEVRRLLKATADHRRGMRDHVIISLALATGLREFEIAALDFGDAFKSGKHVPRQRIALRVFKRSNMRQSQQFVTLNERIRRKLIAHRNAMEAQGLDIEPDSPMFVSSRRQRISVRTIRHMFAQWQAKAGIDRPLTFHCLRHTACTNVWRQTRDLRLVQMFARHADIRSTQRYTHPTTEDLEAGVRDLDC